MPVINIHLVNVTTCGPCYNSKSGRKMDSIVIFKKQNVGTHFTENTIYVTQAKCPDVTRGVGSFQHIDHC